MDVGMSTDPTAPADGTIDITPELRAELRAFRRESTPQRYAKLAARWRPIKQALDACDRAYPNANQLYSLLPDDAEFGGTHELGMTLILLADRFNVLGIWSRGTPARYDLTEYDPDRLTTIGQWIQEDNESSSLN